MLGARKPGHASSSLQVCFSCQNFICNNSCTEGLGFDLWLPVWKRAAVRMQTVLHPAVLYGPLRREHVCTELPTGLSVLSDTHCDLYLHKPASLKFRSSGRMYLCTCKEITAMPSYYRVIWCVFTSRTAKI